MKIPKIDPMVLVITRGKLRICSSRYNIFSSHLTSRYSYHRYVELAADHSSKDSHKELCYLAFSDRHEEKIQ